MSRLRKALLVPVAVWLLVAASQAQAGLINYKYNWAPSSLGIAGDGGSGLIKLTNEPAGPITSGSSDVAATNIKTVSSADPEVPDTLNVQGAYTLTVQITDIDSGLSGQLSFAGKLGGTFSAHNANVTNKFTDQLTKTLTLDKHTYTVTIGPYTPPGPPDSENKGAISSHIDVSNIQIEKVPEPSTMALALFGVSSLGAGWWRRRRLAA